MTFTELNAVEYYFIQRLSGTNLNTINKGEEPKPVYGATWQYIPAQDLNRSVNEVLRTKISKTR